MTLIIFTISPILYVRGKEEWKRMTETHSLLVTQRVKVKVCCWDQSTVTEMMVEVSTIPTQWDWVIEPDFNFATLQYTSAGGERWHDQGVGIIWGDRDIIILLFIIQYATNLYRHFNSIHYSNAESLRHKIPSGIHPTWTPCHVEQEWLSWMV